MESSFRKVDFKEVCRRLEKQIDGYAVFDNELLPYMTVKGAKLVLEIAEEAQNEAIRLSEYATFLEGLIHDLREEKGLPQMPGKEEWEAWKMALPARCRKAINRLAISDFESLCAMSSETLLSQKNFGSSSLKILKDKLAAKGLALRRP